ncbi:hypothetical protein KCU29_004621 [Vibrio parahaemolyticus]|nr:hypothetical protein [Vibrio parahaemolyticus]
MKTVFVEYSSSSFSDLHDKKWVENLCHLVQDTEFDDILDDFLAQWWGTARMFALPELMTSSLASMSSCKSNEMKDSVWEFLVKRPEMQAALWKTAESAYCSFYYAYECFFVSIVSLLARRKVRVTDRDFSKLIQEHLGAKTLTTLWSSNEVYLARELRNSIVHNGGKVTNKLAQFGYNAHLENNNIKVSATDVRNLYTLLQMKVTELVHLMLEKRS